MRNSVKILSFLAIAVTLAACAKESETLFTESVVHELSVTMNAGTYQQSGGETKATMEAVVRANWEAGDKVSVINVTTGKLLGGQLSAAEAGTSVSFTGTVSGTLSDGNKLVYVYPAIKENTQEEAFETVNLDLSSQTYDPSTNKVAFYGYSDEDTYSSASISKKINFNLATSYVHLNMSGLPVSTAVTTIAVSNINGGFSWAIENQHLVIKNYKENGGITVTCTGVTSTSASGNAIARFAVPASDAADERTLSVNNTKTTSYAKAARVAGSYYNQLYANWADKVTVTSAGSGTTTKVDIDDPSTENVAASLPTTGSNPAFNSGKATEITVGGVGTVTFDADATNKILENANAASATSVYFNVENVTEIATTTPNEVVYEITMKTVDENGTEVYSDGKSAGTATITVPLPDATEVNSVSLLNGGAKTAVTSYSFDLTTHTLTFTVGHFSQYAIDYTKATSIAAEADGRQYQTLADAISGVQNGHTVKLIGDVTLSSTGDYLAFIKDKSVNFDLNGFTVTGGENKYCFVFYSTNPANRVSGKIYNGTINSKKIGVYAADYTDVIVENLNITQTTESGTVASYPQVALAVSDGATLYVKSGTYSGDLAAAFIYNSGAHLTIDEGSFTGNSHSIQVDGNQDRESVAVLNGGSFKGDLKLNKVTDNDVILAKGGIYSDGTSVNTYVASGYKVIDNTDASTKADYPYAVVALPNAAKIGTTEYASLADAIAAVPTTGAETTITLLESFDVTGTSPYTIAAGMNVVLDLNGKTISYVSSNTGSDALITNKGDLKVKDSSSGGKITAKQTPDPSWSYGCYTIDNAGTYDNVGHFVLESGTIENTSSSGLAYCLNNGWYGRKADIVINGGTLHNVNYVPLRNYLQQGGCKTITINDGTITSDNSRAVAIQFCDATVNDTGSYVKIKGGTFTCNGSGILYMDMHQANTDATGLTYEVSGGTFTNAQTSNPVVVYDYEGKEHSSAVLLSNFISGGTFNVAPTTDVIATGYKAVDNGNNTWTVQKVVVAKIGTTEYASLAAAIAAVPTTGAETTITLLESFDVTGTSPYTIATGMNVVLDLNGKTISYESSNTGSDALITNKGDLKVKDSSSGGKITAKQTPDPSWSYGCYTIDNAGTYDNVGHFVLESGTIENTSESGLSWCVNNGWWGTKADVEINGGTLHNVNYVPIRNYLQYGGLKTMTINAGTIASDNSRAVTLQLNDATVAETGSYTKIKGGTFTCNGSGILYMDLHAANVNTTNFTYEVTGGTFTNAITSNPVVVYDYEGNDQTSAVLFSSFISGGTFNVKPADEVVASGYEAVQSGSTWTVQQKSN